MPQLIVQREFQTFQVLSKATAHNKMDLKVIKILVVEVKLIFHNQQQTCRTFQFKTAL